MEVSAVIFPSEEKVKAKGEEEEEEEGSNKKGSYNPTGMKALGSCWGRFGPPKAGCSILLLPVP
jgi:hypothetical protein